MTRRVSELIEDGCFVCGVNIVPASACVAIAEHRLVVGDGEDESPIWRRPVVVCHGCLVAASLGEKRGG